MVSILLHCEVVLSDLLHTAFWGCDNSIQEPDRQHGQGHGRAGIPDAC